MLTLMTINLGVCPQGPVECVCVGGRLQGLEDSGFISYTSDRAGVRSPHPHSHRPIPLPCDPTSSAVSLRVCFIYWER